METIIKATKKNDISTIKNIQKELQNTYKMALSNDCVNLLINKNYDSAEKINNFLNFKEENLRKTMDMKDAKFFLIMLTNAIINKEQIVVVGDYDGDGVCAATIFMRTLMNFAYIYKTPQPHWFISNRFTEGYGLSVNAVKRLIHEYPDTKLIVTCDNGIVAFDGIAYAQSKGIEVIVSDHHNASPDGRLPDCPVVCEKRLDEDQDEREGFCGAELARRLCVEVIKFFHKEEMMKNLLDSLYAFSGFATVTDCIDFNGANRYIVKRGLEEINKHNIKSFNALLKVANLKDTIDEDTIGFKLGPMINAAGRMQGVATLPMQLFLTNNDEKCQEYAQQLFDINTQRQDESFREAKIFEEEIEKHNYQDDHFIILDDGDYKEGIAGINASNVVEEYNVPCICLCQTQDPNIYKGSARSVEGFNIKEALDECSGLLVGYGGHPGAAGLSIKKENIDVFRQKMNKLAKNILKDKKKIIEVETWYLPDEMEQATENYSPIIETLAPFGPTFERPQVALKGRFTTDIFVMKEKHIKTSVHYDHYNEDEELIDGKCDVLWFNSLLRYNRLKAGEKWACIIGEPQKNMFFTKNNMQNDCCYDEHALDVDYDRNYKFIARLVYFPLNDKTVNIQLLSNRK